MPVCVALPTRTSRQSLGRRRCDGCSHAADQRGPFGEDRRQRAGRQLGGGSHTNMAQAGGPDPSAGGSRPGGNRARGQERRFSATRRAGPRSDDPERVPVMAAGMIAVGPGPLPFCSDERIWQARIVKRGNEWVHVRLLNYNDDGELITATQDRGRRDKMTRNRILTVLILLGMS